MSGVTLATLVAVGIVTWDEVHVLQRMPCPARYVYVLAIFGAIGLLGSRYPSFAAAVAWALVIGLILEAVSPPSEGGLGLALQDIGSAATRRPASHPKKSPAPSGGGKKPR